MAPTVCHSSTAECAGIFKPRDSNILLPRPKWTTREFRVALQSEERKWCGVLHKSIVVVFFFFFVSFFDTTYFYIVLLLYIAVYIYNIFYVCLCCWSFQKHTVACLPRLPHPCTSCCRFNSNVAAKPFSNLLKPATSFFSIQAKQLIWALWTRLINCAAAGVCLCVCVSVCVYVPL